MRVGGACLCALCQFYDPVPHDGTDDAVVFEPLILLYGAHGSFRAGAEDAVDGHAGDEAVGFGCAVQKILQVGHIIAAHTAEQKASGINEEVK